MIFLPKKKEKKNTRITPKNLVLKKIGAAECKNKKPQIKKGKKSRETADKILNLYSTSLNLASDSLQLLNYHSLLHSSNSHSSEEAVKTIDHKLKINKAKWIERPIVAPIPLANLPQGYSSNSPYHILRRVAETQTGSK